MTPARRAALLALLLLVLAAGLFLTGAREAAGPGRYGTLVFWGVPAAAGVLSGAVFPRRPPVPGGRASPGAALGILPFCAAAFVFDQGFLGAGHLLGWITFTYGDQILSARPIAIAVWAIPACLLLGVLGWERPLRGGVLAGAATRVRPGAAAALACVPGVALSAPAILQGTTFFDGPYVAAALCAAICREAASGVIYLSGGGILLAGLYRGWLFYVEGFGVNDVNALFVPAANYTTSEPRLYALRALSAVLALLVVVAGSRVAGRARS
jgi:hypothetical protein